MRNRLSVAVLLVPLINSILYLNPDRKNVYRWTRPEAIFGITLSSPNKVIKGL